MASDTHVCGYLSKTENTTLFFQCLVMGGGLLTWYFVLVTVLWGIYISSCMRVVYVDILCHLVQNLILLVKMDQVP